MTTFNKTKIVATMGQASAKQDVLEAMIQEGVDICRINFSHGNYDDVKKTIQLIRSINKKLKTNVGILADLQGPKMRIGEVENNSIELISGKEITITTQKCVGTAEKIYLTYEKFPKDVAVGDKILIDDGKIMLETISTNKKDEVKAKIIYGGTLSSKKGFNLPNTKISLPCLTEKDLKDLDFALENDVEWIGLSFVRKVTDVVDLKKIIKEKKKHARVIAKIEKPEAIKEIE